LRFFRKVKKDNCTNFFTVIEKNAMTKFLILLEKFARSKDLTKEIPYTGNLFSSKNYFLTNLISTSNF